MPSVILRYRGPSDDLQQALESLGEEFERSWSPGEPQFKRTQAGKLMEDFGFNLCLLRDDDISRADAIAESIDIMEDLAGKLAPAGHSLHGCTMDIGVFPPPETFNVCTGITAGQCAKLAALGVDFEVTVYPNSVVEVQ